MSMFNKVRFKELIRFIEAFIRLWDVFEKLLNLFCGM